MFIRNAWPHELNNTKPIGRTLLDDPVVLYRQADGAPAALEDRCRRRGLRLSEGAGLQVRHAISKRLADEASIATGQPA